ncbi:MAG: hypothetical protein ACREQ3_19815, partial [Candidatus Binatia bacterium]
MKGSFFRNIFLAVPLCLAWGIPAWAQPVPDSQSGSVEASQATVAPRFDHVPPEQFILDEPSPLSLRQLQRLEKPPVHPRLPPIPVDPGIDPESIVPTNPPTESPIRPQNGSTLPLAPPDFRFFHNQDLGIGAPSDFNSTTNEPSVANKGNVIFQTGNFYAALSTNAGQTFTLVNPFIGPFPPVNNGFCCDQVTIYDPSRDVLFWLQQYRQDATTGTQRINVDRGADGTFECRYDFTPQQLGFAIGDWLDFPDLVLGANFLHHTSNVFNQAGSFTGAIVARYPLDQIGTCGGLNSSFFSDTNPARGSFRATHGAGSTM